MIVYTSIVNYSHPQYHLALLVALEWTEETLATLRSTISLAMLSLDI